MNVIILCGGYGTRLGDLTKNMPKPLLEVAGLPFVAHLIQQLRCQGISEVVLAVSFKSEKFFQILGHEYDGVKISYSLEPSPLGTGGAIKYAMNLYDFDSCVVLNGDTYSEFNLRDLVDFSSQNEAEIAVGLAFVMDTSRYGAVVLNSSNRICKFGEKSISTEGFINAGIYFLKRSIFQSITEANFSFEKSVLEALVQHIKVFGLVSAGNFIDIGVPEDLFRANRYFEAKGSYG